MSYTSLFRAKTQILTAAALPQPFITTLFHQVMTAISGSVDWTGPYKGGHSF